MFFFMCFPLLDLLVLNILGSSVLFKKFDFQQLHDHESAIFAGSKNSTLSLGLELISSGRHMITELFESPTLDKCSRQGTVLLLALRLARLGHCSVPGSSNISVQ